MNNQETEWEKNCFNCRSFGTAALMYSNCHSCKYPFTNWKPKDTSDGQEAKADAGKLELTLVPRQIIRSIAKIRMFGTQKYKDPENWKRVSKERYRNAAFRHFLAYLDNPASLDEESGMPHLWHLSCNLAFLEELEEKDGTFKSRHTVSDDGSSESVETGTETIGQDHV